MVKAVRDHDLVDGSFESHSQGGTDEARNGYCCTLFSLLPKDVQHSIACLRYTVNQFYNMQCAECGIWHEKRQGFAMDS